MKKLLTDQNIYETLLTVYFSKEKTFCLSPQMIKVIDSFIEYCVSEDNFNCTQNVELMRKVYSNPECENREVLLKYLCFSEGALFRFRAKTVERLKTHFETLKKQGPFDLTHISNAY